MLQMSLPYRFALCVFVIAVAGFSTQPTATAQHGGPEQMIRVVWQNVQDRSLHWGEFVQVGPSIVFQNQGKITGFPELTGNQVLGTMERINNMLVLGVKGGPPGQPQGGWLAVDLQVTEQLHGDHSDYTYGDAPRVTLSVLSDSKKYPIHLYEYNNEFYMANDPLNGFTRIAPDKLMAGGGDALGVFYRGGGGHITMAAVNKKVGYSTWMGKTESGKGRIDVVNLNKPGEQSIAYSIESPTPGLHGAITNSGKVFMAPEDGIIWLNADLELSGGTEFVKVNHISLGKNPEDDKPYRTGSFTEHKDWVMFLAGKDDDRGLCLVQASAETPTVSKLIVETKPGLSLGMPECVTALSGKNYAMAFQSKRAGDAVEQLTVINLDPNQDRDFSDAKVEKSIDVGSGLVEGYRSYHSIAFDDDEKFAVFTNPADGEICLFSLDKLKVISRQKVGGIPTGIIATGGEASKH